MTSRIPLIVTAMLLVGAGTGQNRLKTERFDRDPGWEGVNNRSAIPPREIRQDFGFSRTSHAGGKPGEIGGQITPAAEPAYYAKRITPRSFNTPLEASGTFKATSGAFNVFIGFFNSRTVNEWRTPNSLGIRLYGRGEVFYAYVEYCTSKWRAGADSPGGFAEIRNLETGRSRLVGFSVGAPHKWTLRYDPNANGGKGVMTVTMDDETSICHLGDGHRLDGATFDRFGLLNIVKSADGGGEVWLDDLTVNGESNELYGDPAWEGVRNRVKYISTGVRPRFDFGFTPTRHAGGKKRGELGGLVYRGDDLFANTMASYADRIAPLDLSRAIHASGRIALRRAVSDSTALIGFFNSRESLKVRTTGPESMVPHSFLGMASEGPSSEGFFLYPITNINGIRQYADAPDRPHIYPNGKAHDWSLDFDPSTRVLRVKLGTESAALTLDSKAAQANFDRFGIITTTIDGNSQHIYFDDLTYTCR